MSGTAQFNCMDGGERASNNTGYYNQIGVTNISAIGTAGSSGKSYLFGDTSSYCYWAPDNAFNASTIYFGLLYIDNNALGSGTIHLLSSGGNDQIKITDNANQTLSVYCGSNLLWTSPANTIFKGVPIYIEGKLVLSATVGALTLWLNDNPTPACQLTGIDTLGDTTNQNVTHFAWGGYNKAGGARDLYVHDGSGAAPFNGRLGQGSVLWLPVSGVKSNSGFTPNGQATLDAAAATTPPNAATDYDSTATAGATMTLGLTGLPTNVLQVLAVRAIDYSQKTDTGTRALQKTITFGSDAVAGNENYLTISPVVYQDPWIITDPTTGVLFANEGATGISAVNNAEITETVAA